MNNYYAKSDEEWFKIHAELDWNFTIKYETPSSMCHMCSYCNALLSVYFIEPFNAIDPSIFDRDYPQGMMCMNCFLNAAKMSGYSEFMDIYEFLEEKYYKIMSVLMGKHPRLGENSRIRYLPVDILSIIIKDIILE